MLGAAALAASVLSLSALGPLTLLQKEGYPLARCLDGSSSGLYLKTATAGGNNTNDWLIVLDGGGICTHKDDCTARANTSLGSSKFFTPTFNFSSIAFTTDDARNPFKDWNLIFVPYCDGGLHSGQKTVADESTYNLYFSGHHTIDATIQYLAKDHNMHTPESLVVFSGGSAGGVGAFNNLDFVVRSLPDAKVVGAPVGGFPPTVHFFPGVAPPAEELRDIDFARACVKAHTASDAYTCLIPYKMYKYLETPVFISEASNKHRPTMQALTDATILGGFEAVPIKFFDPKVAEFINAYGHNASKNFLQINTARDGLYSPSCIMHCGFLLDRPLINGQNAVAAMHSWVMARSGRSTTTMASPAATTGAGVTGGSSGTGGQFMWQDSCPDGKYYPPCNRHCPKSVSEAVSESFMLNHIAAVNKNKL